MTIHYDTSQGQFTTLASWTGTILPLVLKNPVFWLLVCTHIAFRVVHDHLVSTGAPGLPPISTSGVSMPVSLLTFFVVFYGSNAYSRFFQLYGFCIGMGGATMEWIELVKLYLGGSAGCRWNATRMMLASVHILYYTLAPSDGGSGISGSEWKSIRSRQLLSQAECEAVAAFAGFKPFLPITWALAEVKQQLAEPAAGYSQESQVRILAEFHAKGFALRGNCSQCINLLKQPIPYPYFHVLSLLSLISLVIVGYSMALASTVAVLSGWIYALVCLVFLGLKALAEAMSDPFGDDAVDFEVDTFMKAAYSNACSMLADDFYAPMGEALPDGLTDPVGSRAMPSVRVNVTGFTRRASRPRKMSAPGGGGVGGGGGVPSAKDDGSQELLPVSTPL